jgi:hypothetical protein
MQLQDLVQHDAVDEAAQPTPSSSAGAIGDEMLPAGIH